MSVNGITFDQNVSCMSCFKGQLMKSKKGYKIGLKDIKMKKPSGTVYLIGSKRIEII